MVNSLSDDKIIGVLKSIGMSKNEIKIFLDLIGRDFSSALDIAKRTEIHRSNVYDSLRSLSERGFVSERNEGNRKLFQALDPARIKEYLIQKGREIDSILPELKRVSVERVEDEGVSMSKGLFALRNKLLEILEMGETMSVYGIPVGLRDKIGEGFLDEFNKKRIERGILMRNIYTRDAYRKEIVGLKKKAFTESRYDRRSDPFGVATFICGNKVFIAVFRDVVSIIEINSEEVAKSYMAYFEILWENACF